MTFQPATVLTVLGLGLLAVCAAFAAVGLQNATALLLGMLFVIPAVLNLPLAVIIWVPFAFLPPLGFVGAAPTAGAAVILLAWLPSLRARGAATRDAPRSPPATDPARARAPHLDHPVGELGAAPRERHRPPVAVVARRHRLPRVGHDDLDAAAGAAVRACSCVGALLSALIGILGQSLSTSSDSLALAAADRQRFGSLLDDPNYVAAGFVAAIVLATGLLRPRHPIAQRLLLVARWAS